MVIVIVGPVVLVLTGPKETSLSILVVAGRVDDVEDPGVAEVVFGRVDDFEELEEVCEGPSERLREALLLDMSKTRVAVTDC
jgi:hypothetical protein